MLGMMHLDWSGIPASPTSGELQAALERNRAKYEEAKAKINGEDPDWQKRKDHILEVMCFTIRQYPAKSGVSAEYILGSLNHYSGEVIAPRMIVSEWESKQREYQNICRIEDTRRANERLTP